MESHQENQENLNQNGGEQNPKGWMDLLRRYISKAPKKTPKEQEEETTKIFLDILKEDKKMNKINNQKFPAFFLRNQQILVIYI